MVETCRYKGCNEPVLDPDEVDLKWCMCSMHYIQLQEHWDRENKIDRYMSLCLKNALRVVYGG